jgi:hypothetical protein
MSKSFQSMLLFGTIAAILQQVGYGQSAQFPIERGEAVATCYGEKSNDPVMGVIDVRNPPSGRIGLNWNAPMYHGPNDSWTLNNLGQIFGLALDTVGNIYATATTSYGPIKFGPGGAGGVYRIDGITGGISVLASLPNSGPGLGNIAYDPGVNQLYVTNFEDGKIYRISATGTRLSTFDPYQPDDGKAGFAPRGERIWGIATYDHRIYYSVWWIDMRSGGNPNTLQNEIRSIGFDAAGEFVPADDRHEIWLPQLGNHLYSNPVADISFSTGGRMLLAERSMKNDADPEAHESRLLEYRGVPGNWGSPTIFIVGTTAILTKNSNAAGGATYGYSLNDTTGQECDSSIWATGDALRYPGYNPDGGGDFVYGLAGMPAAGNSAATVASTSYYVDLNGDLSNANKRQLGDVAILAFCSIIPPTPISDTITICEGDSVVLRARGSRSYLWAPGEGLSCTDCSAPRAHPTQTTSYRVRIENAFGQFATDTITVVVQPVINALFHTGPFVPGQGTSVTVPVTLDAPLDAQGITTISLDMVYDGQLLSLHTGASDLADMVRGTLLDGWIVTVTGVTPGSFHALFSSPGPKQTLQGTGGLLSFTFDGRLDSTSWGVVSVELGLPGRSCVRSTPGLDTLYPPPLSDTLTVCEDDTLLLRSRSGRSYHWEPAGGLNCTDCQTAIVLPHGTARYTVRIENTLSRFITDSFTVMAKPSLSLHFHVGPDIQQSFGETVVPVVMDRGIDQESVASLTLDLSYDPNMLWFHGLASDLNHLTDGTLLSGWNIMVTEQREGIFKAIYTTPSPGQFLQGTGGLFNLRFMNLLDTAVSGVISVVLGIPGRECLHGNAGRDTLQYPVCGASNRLIERLAGDYALGQNQPNPFNPTTHISFTIPLDGYTALGVYNSAGELVAMLVDAELSAGSYDMVWDAIRQPSGLYYYLLTSGAFSRVRAMLLVK